MKPMYSSFTKPVFFAAFFLFASHLFAQHGHLLFTAHLTGDQETPAVVTSATGLITILFSDDRTKMFVQGSVSGLSGPATAAHFHAGDAGVAGGVVLDLASIRTGNRFAGELAVPAGFLQKVLLNGIYANVHTAAHAGGEIRGQVRSESDMVFGANMTAGNEVPPLPGFATGLGILKVTLGYDKVQYNFLFNGLSGAATAAHIHEGVAGVAGPVVMALTVNGNSLVGEIPLASLPSNFLTKLMAGQYYVNVHTAAHANGEIRGQLVFNSNLNGFALMTGAQETPPVNTTSFGVAMLIPNKTLDSVYYNVLVRGLSGDATAAHVHNGAAGVAGGVVFPITASVISGVYKGVAAVNAATITDMINNELYFNVHTSANPGGEVRGQIITNLRKGYAFDLCAGQETPTNASQGYGAGMASIDQSNQTLDYQLSINALSGVATAAHIHTGLAGASGPVKFPLTTPTPYSAGAFAITTADAVQIESGGMYMNVHTAANPGGEIRGQVRRGVLCGVVVAVFDPAIRDLQVFPNPVTDAVTIQFDSQDAFDGALRVTDPSGRVLLTQAVHASDTGLQNWTVPMDELAPGVYYLSLEGKENRMFIQPVIKL